MHDPQLLELSLENRADLVNATQADKITITVIILMTTSLFCKICQVFNLFIVRVILIFYQVFDIENISLTKLYIYLYYEFPYHLFNVTAYIVLIQWYSKFLIL
jgi:hypothetical protein